MNSRESAPCWACLAAVRLFCSPKKKKDHTAARNARVVRFLRPWAWLGENRKGYIFFFRVLLRFPSPCAPRPPPLRCMLISHVHRFCRALTLGFCSRGEGIRRARFRRILVHEGDPLFLRTTLLDVSRNWVETHAIGCVRGGAERASCAFVCIVSFSVAACFPSCRKKGERSLAYAAGGVLQRVYRESNCVRRISNCYSSGFQAGNMKIKMPWFILKIRSTNTYIRSRGPKQPPSLFFFFLSQFALMCKWPPSRFFCMDGTGAVPSVTRSSNRVVSRQADRSSEGKQVGRRWQRREACFGAGRVLGLLLSLSLSLRFCYCVCCFCYVREIACRVGRYSRCIGAMVLDSFSILNMVGSRSLASQSSRGRFELYTPRRRRFC